MCKFVKKTIWNCLPIEIFAFILSFFKENDRINDLLRRLATLEYYFNGEVKYEYLLDKHLLTYAVTPEGCLVTQTESGECVKHCSEFKDNFKLVIAPYDFENDTFSKPCGQVVKVFHLTDDNPTGTHNLQVKDLLNYTNRKQYAQNLKNSGYEVFLDSSGDLYYH